MNVKFIKPYITLYNDSKTLNVNNMCDKINKIIDYNKYPYPVKINITWDVVYKQTGEGFDLKYEPSNAVFNFDMFISNYFQSGKLNIDLLSLDIGKYVVVMDNVWEHPNFQLHPKNTTVIEKYQTLLLEFSIDHEPKTEKIFNVVIDDIYTGGHNHQTLFDEMTRETQEFVDSITTVYQTQRIINIGYDENNSDITYKQIADNNLQLDLNVFLRQGDLFDTLYCGFNVGSNFDPQQNISFDFNENSTKSIFTYKQLWTDASSRGLRYFAYFVPKYTFNSNTKIIQFYGYRGTRMQNSNTGAPGQISFETSVNNPNAAFSFGSVGADGGNFGPLQNAYLASLILYIR